MEAALELRACSLLAFRRYRGVADMLRDYIPSCTKPTCFLCCFDISNLKHRVLADGEAAAHRRRPDYLNYGSDLLHIPQQ
ncbi:hypothetical protein OsI_16365 [Oryza sativa Indica Group]|uniref:Uncharacterized protein n=1 Tax=Oryza sativa subsp. indica TaxID=39946 RepID=A2XUS9_ORYSI|nr:hypothetical protein OsI_16365 [Oryza sativa Indica Group]